MKRILSGEDTIEERYSAFEYLQQELSIGARFFEMFANDMKIFNIEIRKRMSLRRVEILIESATDFRCGKSWADRSPLAMTVSSQATD